MSKLTDDSIIGFGIHKGKKLSEVPATYLIWLYDNDKCSNEMRKYLKDNIDVLYKEIEDTKF